MISTTNPGHAKIHNQRFNLYAAVYVVGHESCLYFISLSYPENIMPDTEEVEPVTMTIGTNNVFEVGCGILLRQQT